METKLVSIRDKATDMAMVDVMIPASTSKGCVTAVSECLQNAYLAYREKHGDGYGFPWTTETILAFKECGVSASSVAYDEILYFDIDN